ncbi:MAG TPA: type III secretion system chaperone [Ramlibacter sp.]|nr:type III secretion system chaperone [Ramlibacter sp.]
MDKRTLANDLISSLGNTLTVRDLRLDESTASCVLVFDGDLVLNIAYDEPTGQLVLSAYLDELPAEGAEPILRELLAANLYWHRTRGATLALEEGTNGIVLAYRASVTELDAASFEACVENFVKQAERWHGRIVAGKEEAARASTGSAAAEPARLGGLIYG